MSEDLRSDGTVAFLPHRLNHHPVVVRGLTANELWVCAGLSGGIGLVAGIPLAILCSTVALIPTTMVLAIAAGVLIGGSAVRRIKRGRPEAWLYRHLQWWLATHLPPLAALVGGHTLVTRSGYWTTRRSKTP